MLDIYLNRKIVSIKPNIAFELEIVQSKSQGPESQTEATESIVTESVAIEPEKPEQEVEPQEDNNARYSKGNELVLAKYVTRHHTLD